MFNALMRETDVLWTKPSELCFYAGLGIPIVMSPPLGAHEEHNQTALMRAGAGYPQEDPARRSSGFRIGLKTACSRSARSTDTCTWQTRGTENIKRVCLASDRSTVELRGVPPTLRNSQSVASGDATCGS